MSAGSGKAPTGKTGAGKIATGKAETRQVLLDAALEVFLQHGFAGATTREIARTAGVAEGTIYRHFSDKLALFHEVFLSVAGGDAEELERFADRAGQGTVRENLERLFRLFEDLQKRQAPLLASMWADTEVASSFAVRAQEQGMEGYRLDGPQTMVAEYIRAEQALGRIRADVDPVEAAAIVVALPFARGVQRTLAVRPAAGQGGVQPPEAPPPDAPQPPDDTAASMSGALDILARGLTP